MDNKEKQKVQKSNKIIFGVFIFLSFYSGWFLGHQDLDFQKGKLTPQISNKEKSVNVDFSSFWKTWDLLVANYDGEIDPKKLVEGATRGLVEAVGDPYTVFMSAEETKEFESDLSGSISGIGAEVGIKDEKVTIIAPIDDSPAQKAGLKSGDIVLSINGEDTSRMSLGEAVSKIRGKEGTKVKLLVQRGSEKKEYEITRAKIQIQNVKWEIKNSNIGYIEIVQFDETSTSKFKEAINDLVSKNIKGLIVDVRNNPGGLLDSSIMISSELIKEGVIVLEKNKEGNIKEAFKATGTGKLTDPKIPVVVLINGGSASASEIFAGAIQDKKRGTLIGEKTFGKGSVQQIEEVGKGASLRLTIAHWFTPENRNIDKQGLLPDIEVKLSEEDIKNEKDSQLEKAIEIIKGKIK